MLGALKTLVRDRPRLRAGVLRVGGAVRRLDRAEAGLYTLCYHRVAPAAQDNFRQQLDVLKRYGDFVDADSAAARLVMDRPWTDRLFLLSFDDGYLDNVEVALPVIRACAVPAIQFLVSDWLDHPPAAPDHRGYMTRADVSAWLAAGLDIGSHTATHRRLSGLGPGEVETEFRRSARALEALAGRPVRHFACPWGVGVADYDPVLHPKMAAACGYATFFTTRRGRARSGSDLMAMPRHVIEPEWPAYQLHALMGRSAFARA